MTACGGGGGGGNSQGTVQTSSAPQTPTTVQASASVAIYPAGSAAGKTGVFNDARLYVPITAVGNQPLPSALPLILDTGSAGMTVYAQALFPASMVSSDGFVFPQGATTLQYNGITVTNVQASKSFDGTTQYGNLGFANVTFGANGELTTASMPIFIYYKIMDTSGVASGKPPTLVTQLPTQQGIFGINTAANLMVVAGSATPTALSICTPQSTTSCHMVSPLRYLSYGADIHAGFMLSPATLQPSCDVSSWAGCTQAHIFTVGLTSASESGFTTETLQCPGNQPKDTSGAGISPCQPFLPNITFSDTTLNQNFKTGVVFDTGTAHNVINSPSSASYNPAMFTGGNWIASGEALSITTSTGVDYAYATGAPRTTTATQLRQGASSPSIVGIDFFTTRAFFIDFATNTEGFK